MSEETQSLIRQGQELLNAIPEDQRVSLEERLEMEGQRERERRYSDMLRDFNVVLPQEGSLSLRELQMEFKTLLFHLSKIYELFDLEVFLKDFITCFNDVVTQSNKSEYMKKPMLVMTNKFIPDIFSLYEDLTKDDSNVKNNIYKERILSLLNKLHSNIQSWKTIDELEHAKLEALSLISGYNSKFSRSTEEIFQEHEEQISSKNFKKSFNYLNKTIKHIKELQSFTTSIYQTPFPADYGETQKLRNDLTMLFFMFNDILTTIYHNLFLKDGLLQSIKNLDSMFETKSYDLDNISLFRLTTSILLLTLGTDTSYLLKQLERINGKMDSLSDVETSMKEQFKQALPPKDELYEGTYAVMPIEEEKPLSSGSNNSSSSSSYSSGSFNSDDIKRALSNLKGVNVDEVMKDLRNQSKREDIPWSEGWQLLHHPRSQRIHIFLVKKEKEEKKKEKKELKE